MAPRTSLCEALKPPEIDPFYHFSLGTNETLLNETMHEQRRWIAINNRQRPKVWILTLMRA